MPMQRKPLKPLLQIVKSKAKENTTFVASFLLTPYHSSHPDDVFRDRTTASAATCAETKSKTNSTY